MREITINRVQEGQRLDRFLARCLPGASSGFLHKMLRKKNIKLNDARAEGSEKLKEGDRIQVYFSEETYEKFAGESPAAPASGKPEKPIREDCGLRSRIRILYKDRDVVAFHKPAGLLSQKSASGDDSLNDYLLDLCRKEGWLDEESMLYFHPSVANRLDRNTSGIVLCGISTTGLQHLSSALRDRNLAKYYLALVCGQVTGSRTLKGYLRKDRDKNLVTYSSVMKKGFAPIETGYEVLASGKEISLLKVRLITGKSHQIRAHLAAEGFPVLGDNKYGDREMNRKIRTALGISRHLLHCCRVDFGSHYGGLVIRDGLPEDFEKTMEYFGLALSRDRREDLE